MALEKSKKYSELSELVDNYLSSPNDERLVSTKNLEKIASRLKSKYKSEKSYNKIVEKQSSGNHTGHSKKNRSWSAIICLWKRKEYIKEQIKAIKSQSISPIEIICLINENHFKAAEITELKEQDCKIILSEINSLYNRWAVSYVCRGDYVCIFDDDTIPGSSYIENAIRCCDGYDCMTGASGRIYDPNGRESLYKIVSPVAHDGSFVSCSADDIYCDWVCNSYLFKRSWVPSILDEMSKMESFSTYDDMQAALSLFRSKKIGCIVPFQPQENKELIASLYPEFGSDNHAVWLNYNENHFVDRRKYIKREIETGNYTPVAKRGQTRFHIIIPFGSRVGLDWCLRSVASQVYDNYIVYIVDDCCDNKSNETKSLIYSLGIDQDKTKLFITNEKSYPLLSRCIAYENMNAQRSDVVVHLDGDDFLTNPDVLQLLDEIYCCSTVKMTHGGSVTVTTDAKFFATDKHSLYSEYSEAWRSVDWCSKYNNLTGRLVKETKFDSGTEYIDVNEIKWGHMHLRSHRYHLWHDINKQHFKLNGMYVKAATDMAIFLPMLLITKKADIKYIDRLVYAYTRYPKGTSTQTSVGDDLKAKYISHILSHMNNDIHKNPPSTSNIFNYSEIYLNRNDVDFWGATNTKSKHLAARKLTNRYNPKNHPIANERYKLAIFTIVTSDYIADGMLAIMSLRKYGNINGDLYIFLSESSSHIDESWLTFAKNLGVTIIFRESLTNNEAIKMSRLLLDKYKSSSDEYRWSMKSVLSIELLSTKYQQVIFTDPDTLTVSPVADVFENASKYGMYLFPHFRHYDCENSRKTLYSDGFYNGGLFSATPLGIKALSRWFNRCLTKMDKSISNNTFVDQKYLDTLTYEDVSIGQNLDRGIDFNTWNNENVINVAPSIKSFLLESANFIRHWHFTVGMIDASVKGHTKHKIFNTAIAEYVSLRLILLYALEGITRNGTYKTFLKPRIDTNLTLIKSITEQKISSEKRNTWGVFNPSDVIEANSKTLKLIESYCIKGPLFEFIDFVSEIEIAANLVKSNKNTDGSSECIANDKYGFSNIISKYCKNSSYVNISEHDYLSEQQKICINEIYSSGSSKSLLLDSSNVAGYKTVTHTWHFYEN